MLLFLDMFLSLAGMPEQVDRAYIEACRKEIKQVFNARIILAGYSGGGKTSLANRLLGEQINVDERHSTEGIALHRIESTFNRKVMKGAKWDKKELNSEDLKKDFNLGLVDILQKGKRKVSTDSTDTDGDSQPQETTAIFIENEDDDIRAPKYPKNSPPRCKSHRKRRIWIFARMENKRRNNKPCN